LGASLRRQPGARLDAALAGRATPAPVAADAGAAYVLGGAGRLLGGEAVRVTGTLRGTGMVAQGRATGELAVGRPRGTLTLDLVGPRQGAFAALPVQFGFTVRSRTGAYAHRSGTGSVAVHVGGDGTFALAILFA